MLKFAFGMVAGILLLAGIILTVRIRVKENLTSREVFNSRLYKLILDSLKPGVPSPWGTALGALIDIKWGWR
jgi:hypothetical protein